MSEDESLICTDITPMLFKKGRSLQGHVNKLLEDFYVCVGNCKKEFGQIIDSVPPEWNIRDRQQFLESQLFNTGWIEETKHNFSLYLEKSLL